MKRLSVLFFCFAVIFTMVGCSETSEVGNPKEHTNMETVAAEKNQKVDGGLYEVSIPGAWKSSIQAGQATDFSLNDTRVGGVQILAYDPGEPLSALMSNHSEVLQQEELKGFAGRVFKVRLKITPPAASGETWEKNELHYFFIHGNQAFDLYFETDQVKDIVAEEIAKSFRIKAAETGEQEKEQQMKTDSGRYQGQADNNFIEIKVSGVPEEKSAKVFMISDKVREKFNLLNLKKDDQVKFQYFENQYGQLVLLSIEKI